jgi:cell division inhibitor SulA
VIEVKRLEAGKNRIIRDFEKLSKIPNPDKKIRCFVLLVCQQKLPKEFVNESGVAKAGVLTFTSLTGKIDVKVLRTCKSTFSFKENAILKANYVCLIEVL